MNPVPPPWSRYTDATERLELDRIAHLVDINKACIDDLLAARRTVMHRVIRRMRRAEGKE